MKKNWAAEYDAYLVRLWRKDSQTFCYASATSVRTGKTVRFATMEALYAFLQARAAHGNDVDSAASSSK